MQRSADVHEERATGRNAHMSGRKGLWRLHVRIAAHQHGVCLQSFRHAWHLPVTVLMRRYQTNREYIIHHTYSAPRCKVQHTTHKLQHVKVQRSEHVPPASGDTMTTSSAEVFISSVLMYSSSSGVAYRLSIGNETKPWICSSQLALPL